MEIDPTRTSTASTATGANNQLDRTAFMRLLVAQIRNQDPANPMDSRELMSQLTQLTSVEHLMGIEERLGSLSIASAGMANAQVASFVGRTIEADTSTLRLEDVGTAAGAYQIDQPAAHVTVTIRDGEGQVVRTIDLGAQPAGSHSIEWDGRDGSGVRLEPGSYRMEVAATDEQRHPIEARTRVRGVVSSVSYEHGYPELVIGELQVLMGDIRRVEDQPATEPVSQGVETP